jgi:hypothetical protein
LTAFARRCDPDFGSDGDFDNLHGDWLDSAHFACLHNKDKGR